MPPAKKTVESAVDLTLYKYLLPEGEWQELWFATLVRPWSSLVIVPASEGVSGLAVASALADVAKLHRAKPVQMVNAEATELVDANALIESVRHQTARGELVIVSVGSLFENQAAIPIARAADAALLCVELGGSDFASAEKTLAMIGRERFIGSVNLAPAKK